MNNLTFHTLGSISFEKINQICILASKSNNILLIYNKQNKKWELPIGERILGEESEFSAKKLLLEKAKIAKSNLVPILLYSYSVENSNIIYGVVYHADVISELTTCIDNSIEKKWVPKINIYEYTKNDSSNFLKKVLNERKVVNSWYISDTRDTIGRYSIVHFNNQLIKIKQAIADPINIVQTMKNYFKNNLNGPIQLDINPTSICSDKCLFCFNATDRKGNIETLDFNKLKTCLDYFIKETNVMHIKCSGFGEPTLYKDIWNLYKYTREKGLYNTLNTNGFNLDKHMNNVLSYLDSIRFSIDAYDKDSFFKIHRINDFEIRMKNIKELIERRNVEQPHLIIGIHYVVLPENYIGLHNFIEKIRALGIDYIDITLGKFNANYLKQWNNDLKDAISMIKSSVKYKTNSFNVILPHEETLNEIDLERFRCSRFNNKKCWQLILRNYIAPNGDYGACNAFDSQLIPKRVYGNIYVQSPKDILFNLSKNNNAFDKCKKCKYCVIPHGAFNDLCDLINENPDIQIYSIDKGEFYENSR